ncbi:TIGR03668 family PPOX class F420-dependent oxidoreductase [Catellatospora tritici]|uniref:TIGR03668 family PPOX class F420-dependent oxidoreductase n=1 Tax=Catellatospora tritici TaxID=2851566 RepID=UPI001C2D203B|nr:TIGR03668 family PPOX class F420-dependent oxidoreductase [Catellatospora tritici]MBV1853903.1 TIGR03668 family PPOX class F420-dependent oxidoreductase [Catellatospora tritici]
MRPAERFASARVARLATVDASGCPHLVPIVFALDGDTLYSAVDRKPKRTTALRRLANVAVQSRVSVLADHYEEDWSRLWWVRADGAARVLALTEPESEHALRLLTSRYPQYADQPPPGPVLAVDVDRWSAWSADG